MPDLTTGEFAERDSIAVILPRRNQGLTIAHTVLGFRQALPGAAIHVHDDRSDDNTGQLARAAGAQVLYQGESGADSTLRRMLADIEADLYVIADGDGSCDPAEAVRMIEALVDTGSDMVIGARKPVTDNLPRFRRMQRWLLGAPFSDIDSGYRVLSRRFVKSLALVPDSFGIAKDMAIHAFTLDLAVAEIAVGYEPRPTSRRPLGQAVRERMRLAWSMVRLIQAVRPMLACGLVAAGLMALSVGLAVPVVARFVETGFVTRLPTAVLCTGLMLTAVMIGGTGLVLDSLNRLRTEQRRLCYLALGAFRSAPGTLNAREGGGTDEARAETATAETGADRQSGAARVA